MTTQVPQIDRQDWSSHPNFPSHVLLLGSHQNFRAFSASLIEAAAEGESVPRLRFAYEYWIRGMRSHEAYEERKLYPFLSRRWGVSFADSEAGHQALHDAHDGVLAAFETGEHVVEALKTHDEVLRAHLEVEEAQVIPLLLSLEPQEFRDFIG